MQNNFQKNWQVPPRFELGSLDSESKVLTTTPWNHRYSLYLISIYLLSTRNKIVQKAKVPPRFELGSLDSKSKVLTTTPWDLQSPIDVYLKLTIKIHK